MALEQAVGILEAATLRVDNAAQEGAREMEVLVFHCERHPANNPQPFAQPLIRATTHHSAAFGDPEALCGKGRDLPARSALDPCWEAFPHDLQGRRQEGGALLPRVQRHHRVL